MNTENDVSCLADALLRFPRSPEISGYELADRVSAAAHPVPGGRGRDSRGRAIPGNGLEEMRRRYYGSDGKFLSIWTGSTRGSIRIARRPSSKG